MFNFGKDSYEIFDLRLEYILMNVELNIAAPYPNATK